MSENGENSILRGIERVVELHTSRQVVTHPGPGPICVECRYVWPCPTIEAVTCNEQISQWSQCKRPVGHEGDHA